jgi:hypothetical protein
MTERVMRAADINVTLVGVPVTANDGYPLHRYARSLSTRKP